MTHRKDGGMEVIFIGTLALVHGGFWLLVGLGIGHLLWSNS